MYYDALEHLYHEAFSNDGPAKKFATAILEAEYAYTAYQQTPENQAALASFKEKMEIAKSLYDSISNTDMRNQHFKEIFDYYSAVYDTLN